MDSRAESLVDAALALKNLGTQQEHSVKNTGEKSLPPYSNMPKDDQDDNVSQGSLPDEKKGFKGKTFPRQLMDLLNDKELNHIIAWLPRGHAFVVKDYKKFSSNVLPNYFNKGIAYTSFTRRLVRWGFQNIAKCTYYHEHFHRDRPQLSILMSYNGGGKCTKGSDISTTANREAKKSHAEKNGIKNGRTRRTREGNEVSSLASIVDENDVETTLQAASHYPSKVVSTPSVPGNPIDQHLRDMVSPGLPYVGQPLNKDHGVEHLRRLAELSALGNNMATMRRTAVNNGLDTESDQLYRHLLNALPVQQLQYHIMREQLQSQLVSMILNGNRSSPSGQQESKYSSGRSLAA